jgi:hypothetical protein
MSKASSELRRSRLPSSDDPKESGKEQGQELASNLRERALESGTASEAAAQTY